MYHDNLQKPIWPFVWKNIPIHMFMCLFLFFYFYFSQLKCFNFTVSILLTYTHVYLFNLYRFLHTCMTYLFSQLICFNFTVSILLTWELRKMSQWNCRLLRVQNFSVKKKPLLAINFCKERNCPAECLFLDAWSCDQRFYSSKVCYESL